MIEQSHLRHPPNVTRPGCNAKESAMRQVTQRTQLAGDGHVEFIEARV
jgi:hypothetical protein